MELEFRLQVAMRALGFPVKKEEVRKILSDYDREGAGKIAFDDFVEVSEFLCWAIAVLNEDNRATRRRYTRCPAYRNSVAFAHTEYIAFVITNQRSRIASLFAWLTDRHPRTLAVLRCSDRALPVARP